MRTTRRRCARVVAVLYRIVAAFASYFTAQSVIWFAIPQPHHTLTEIFGGLFLNEIALMEEIIVFFFIFVATAGLLRAFRLLAEPGIRLDAR